MNFYYYTLKEFKVLYSEQVGLDPWKNELRVELILWGEYDFNIITKECINHI